MSKVLLQITAEDCEAARQQVDQGLSPRKDYLQLADALEADVLDLGAVQADPMARRLDRVFRRGVGHAWVASHMASQYDAVFSDGEHIGLPLGIMLRRKRNRCRHVMIGHRLSAWKKRPLSAWAKNGIDAIIVHCNSQLEFAIHKLRADPGQVYLLPYQVDVDFWQPQPDSEELLIVSSGLEKRDYGTLMEAVRDLPVGVRVGAMSHWSKDKNRLSGKAVPPNTTVGSYNYLELRDLYSRARFVIVPVRDVDFQAGITTILEAMAMGKAVIVTRTRGQQEAVIGPLWRAGLSIWPADGPSPEEGTGIYVPPGDGGALRSAIVYLLERPLLAAVLGGNGRRFVEEHANLDQFVRRVAAVIDPAWTSPALTRLDMRRGA